LYFENSAVEEEELMEKTCLGAAASRTGDRGLAWENRVEIEKRGEDQKWKALVTDW
jgi:hypothetical protein